MKVYWIAIQKLSLEIFFDLFSISSFEKTSRIFHIAQSSLGDRRLSPIWRHTLPHLSSQAYIQSVPRIPSLPRFAPITGNVLVYTKSIGINAPFHTRSVGVNSASIKFAAFRVRNRAKGEELVYEWEALKRMCPYEIV